MNTHKEDIMKAFGNVVELVKVLVVVMVIGLTGCGGGKDSVLDNAESTPEPETQGNQLEVTPGEFLLAKGGGIQLIAQVFDEADSLVMGTDDDPVVLEWRSSNSAVALVDEYGFVNGLEAGSATIAVSAKYGDEKLTAEAELEVVFSDMKAINVTPQRLSLDVSGKKEFTAVASDKDGRPTTLDCPDGLRWDFDEKYVSQRVSGSNSVILTGKTKGPVLITAYCSGFASSPAIVDVKPIVKIPLPGTDSDFGVDPSLTISRDNIHIASYDQLNRTLTYTFFRGIWSTETLDGEGDYGRKSTITLDSLRGDRATICAVENRDLTCWLQSASGAWGRIAIDEISPSASSYDGQLNLAINDRGVMYLLYYNKVDNSLKLATSYSSTRSDWEILTVVANGGRFNSLALNEDGEPRVALQFDNRAFYGAPDSDGVWSFEPIDNTKGSGNFIKLEIGSDNRPQAVYFKNSRLIHAIKENGQWAGSVVDNLYGTGESIGFALDPADLARISYYDDNERTLKYASRLRKERIGADNRWSIVEPDASGHDVGLFSSLVVDRYFKGVLVFYDYDSRILRLYVEPHFSNYNRPQRSNADLDINDDIQNPVLLDEITPFAEDISVITEQNSLVEIELLGFDDGDILSYQIVDSPANGSLSGTPPYLIYTPNTDYSGNDIFTYQVSDSSSNSNIARVSVEITLGPDISAPSGTNVIINGGSLLTTSQNVTLTLYAVDDRNVTAFYVSENPAAPTLYSQGWQNVTGTDVLNTNVPFLLSNENEIKTVYAWFRDDAGNISASAGDTIELVGDSDGPGPSPLALYEVEPNNSFDEAFVIAEENSYTGHQSGGSDSWDIFQIRATAPVMTVSISHSSPNSSESDFTATVFDYYQNNLDKLVANNGISNSITLGVEAGETYFIRINVDRTPQQYEYTLQVRFES